MGGAPQADLITLSFALDKPLRERRDMHISAKNMPRMPCVPTTLTRSQTTSSRPAENLAAPGALDLCSGRVHSAQEVVGRDEARALHRVRRGDVYLSIIVLAAWFRSRVATLGSIW